MILTEKKKKTFYFKQVNILQHFKRKQVRYVSFIFVTKKKSLSVFNIIKVAKDKILA